MPVLILTFGAGAILAAGTNFLLGTISFVSDSVTIVLQLALSIDYAVIFCNRYKEEHQKLDIREADIVEDKKHFRTQALSLLEDVGDDTSMVGDNYGWQGEDL